MTKKTVTPIIRCMNTDAPAHRERAETLIEDIKRLFLSDMKDSCSDDDLIKRLQMVDTIECLGIDRHFQTEIKVAMDYVYSCWNERGIGPGSRDSLSTDLNSTALGFRALRMHRYNVSSDVFENFKDENGHFFCTSSGEEGTADEEVRSMLSLFRASNISFPGEKVMEEAKTFTTEYLSPVKTFTAQYLSQVLTRHAIAHVNQSLRKEVKYALEFPWHCSVPRWEARNFIEIYEQNYLWLRSNINQKFLELAKLDSNILQSTHKKEMQLISRWDSSLAGRLPDHIKKIFEFFMNTANEWTAEVEKMQGRDMAAYIRRNGWERYLESNLQEAEWIAAGYVPSFNEYLENGLASSRMCVLNLIPLLVMGKILPDDILKQIVYPSKIQYALELTIRLKDDITDFELEKERGEVASSLECYLKDNPECTGEDALNHMKGILDLSVSELNWEFLKNDNVPLCCKRFTFNLARSWHFLFKYKDFLSISDTEVKNQLFKVLMEPVQL